MLDLTEKLMSRHAPRERAKGRVYVSEVYALLQGWEQRPVGVFEAIRMLRGETKHNLVQSLLPDTYQMEVKVEYPFGNGLVLVGKADALADDHGLEIKTSEELLPSAKEWQVCQSRLYAALFHRPFVIVQPVWTADKLYLKKLRECREDQAWFEKTLKILETLNNRQ